ncbi:MAG: DNA repair protein RecN [Ignavibacteriae bacterium]|nr:DNA repair protein RecN [Ignavibacteriota bacterium]
MLKSLNIKNYALIDELIIEFINGLTIVTGETGAGKSIIIDAFSMILGERADSDVVRKGSEKAIVEAVFQIQHQHKLKQLLKEQDRDCTDQLIIRREISIKSQNRCFINDSPSTISLLKQVGDLLVDLHGQHEHQSLLRKETHIEMLDDFCGLNESVKGFAKLYANASSIMKEIEALQSKKKQLDEKRSLFEFQLTEILAVNPTINEEELLEKELKILENSERLSLESEQLYHLLYNGELSIVDKFGVARKHLVSLQNIDESFSESAKELESANSIVNELTAFLRNYRSNIEFKPERLEEIRTKLGKISLLKKKYGGTMESVLRQKESVEKELFVANNYETELEIKRKEFEQARTTCSKAAHELSKKRQDGVKKLNKKIVQTLTQLGIQNAQFETRIVQQSSNQEGAAIVKIGNECFDCSLQGIDDVEFFISTNVGESPKPLVKVASGGEVSRIMLSLKMNVVTKESVPLLIFDEIDVGISGRIAQSVGQAMKELAEHHQVIAITHLPQIAGFADTHFVVEKIEDGKRAITKLKKLNEKERVVEVARLMSGEEVTEAGLQSARELIEYSNN